VVAGRITLLRGAQRDLAARERRVEHLAVALRHLNPASVLERGYSIVTKSDASIVESSAQIAVGDALSIRFAAGSATAAVTDKE